MKNSYCVLFSYHRKPEATLESLQFLRQRNPGIPIYGLYGGSPEWLSAFQNVIDLLDDNWAYFNEPIAPRWNVNDLYRNIDLLYCQWFLSRGNQLPWDFVLMHQWDMLLLDSVGTYIDPLDKDDYLSIPHVQEYQPLLDIGWGWVTHEPEYPLFDQYMKTHISEQYEFYGGGSLFEVMPRRLFEELGDKLFEVPGMSEYRIPTFARMYGFRFPFIDYNGTMIHFDGKGLPVETVLEEIRKPDGARIFHPVFDWTEKMFTLPAPLNY